MPTDPATDAPLVARRRVPREVASAEPHEEAMTDSELFAAAVAASGLSVRKFCEKILKVNERTGRRWLTGESTIRDRSLRARVERHAAKLSNLK